MRSFTDIHIMIVEDDPLLSLDLADSLREAGLQIVGPFSSIEDALQGMASHRPQIAVLDIDLNGQMSFPVADALGSENVPFLWLSGSSRDILPNRYRAHPFLSKPFVTQRILQTVSDLLPPS